MMATNQAGDSSSMLPQGFFVDCRTDIKGVVWMRGGFPSMEIRRIVTLSAPD
ncbi:MAG: hypothetical protein OXE87_13495 [Chloroflexi bacterium]|nr:hypothetical protein [Chloroflexota bacterium]